MPPPPAARARLLDAFIEILIENGERAATLEAVATEAGVSKGGLLYHFGSKDALVEGLVAYLEELAAADIDTMRTAPEGPAAYYLTTSNYADSPLDRAIVSTMRLSQGANARAQEALLRIHHGWMDALADEMGDRTAARMVALMGDGLYYNAALSGNTVVASQQEMNDLLDMVRRITRSEN
ncbi:TetR family transcriptional regulator [Rhodococcus triatomae]|uniref:Regulatory protein, tetR family n=1 Tax=Rhodococcus triatomae TaxID=300028 RepID=A0A1G8DSM1_9NOCA|nr:TetR/AcrR family transcriptional regulator [Rhodococcus triatomae]QNG18356.1 TetR family transcriptional regulator [Rhodococcus triatomae]QNG21974.1 TetR family transcriptional regulator [Rhodococcus triatomae]SDH60595.1 regulatory protein, tetR family [Rhodococcus triatomae]